MTEEPKFAPPMPPKAPAFGGPAPTPGLSTEAPKAEKPATGIPANNFAAALKISPRIFETKIMAAILGGCVFFGMLLGMVFFGGSSAPQQVVRQGLSGVVPNPDIRTKMARCGMVSNTAPCMVYIMNHERNDRRAEYFFDQAAKLTGRAPYLIRIENQYYATAKISPGQIAKIKIPALR
ncbi:MAG: hypothetical protein IKS41_01405 [Alphaproteobacteria bacterium]|nr:hypothetical protein [Alphaproteobacteria bacterium]